MHGPVLPEVEAHDVRDDAVAFVALQVELQGAAVEHGHVALVHAAPVRRREAAQNVGPGVVVEVGVEQVPGFGALAARKAATFASSVCGSEGGITRSAAFSRARFVKGGRSTS